MNINSLPLPAAQILYYTNNGGITWVPKNTLFSISTVDFIDSQTGWLLGKSDPDPEAPTQLNQTINGGETWNEISSECPVSLGSELQLTDDHSGFAYFPYSVLDHYQYYDDRTLQANQLFAISDGGRTWIRIEPRIDPMP